MEKVHSLRDMFKSAYGLVWSGIIIFLLSFAALALLINADTGLGAIVFMVMSVTGVILFVNGIRNAVSGRKTAVRYEASGEAEAVIADYNSESAVKLDRKGSVAFGEKYLFALNCGMIYPYSEVVWTYVTINKQNGMGISQLLTVCTSDGRKHTIITEKVTLEGSEKLAKYISAIVSRNPDCRTGYSAENIREYKAAVKAHRTDR